jgi:hypothetical protein
MDIWSIDLKENYSENGINYESVTSQIPKGGHGDFSITALSKGRPAGCMDGITISGTDYLEDSDDVWVCANDISALFADEILVASHADITADNIIYLVDTLYIYPEYRRKHIFTEFLKILDSRNPVIVVATNIQKYKAGPDFSKFETFPTVEELKVRDAVIKSCGFKKIDFDNDSTVKSVRFALRG